MKILFVSRAFPPIIGGIENHNAALAQWLPEHATVTTIANRHGRKALPWFLPIATLRVLFLMPQYDVLLLGDGVLALLGFLVKKFFPKKKVVSVVHALDINYHSRSLGVWYERVLIGLYRSLWVKRFLPSLDAYIAVSRSTKQIALEHGLSTKKVFVIPNGIETDRFKTARDRGRLETILGRSVTDRIVLLTSGRLVKRKGVAWFIHHVVPQLDSSILYVVAGDGPDRPNIEGAINASVHKSDIVMTGRVSDEDLKTLFSSSDIFVQPNIPIPGDAEGFGISVIEAGATGLPVVASSLEGLRDAIVHGENGILVPTENADQFAKTINELSQNTDERRRFGDHAARFVEATFHWRLVARTYIETLEHILGESSETLRP